MGLDLTGSERRASGWALLDGARLTTLRLKSDAELIAQTVATNPALISIDAPLTLPGAKQSLDECAGLPIYRACELALRRRGIGVYWCLLPSMRALTLRGIALARAFTAAGIETIEAYPGGAQDVLGIARKRTSVEGLRRGLHRAGLRGAFARQRTSHDELDAATAALVGLFYLAGEYERIGDDDEGTIVMPCPRAPA